MMIGLLELHEDIQIDLRGILATAQTELVPGCRAHDFTCSWL
jgi:hypothetical protein